MAEQIDCNSSSDLSRDEIVSATRTSLIPTLLNLENQIKSDSQLRKQMILNSSNKVPKNDIEQF